LRNRQEEEKFYPLVIGQCQESGIICLTTPFPPNELVPVFDWITYNEPEPHLDHTVDLLCSLKGINKQTVVGGITFKDDSTLARFNHRGFKTWRVDIHNDLGVSIKGAGVESIQASLTTEKALRISEKYGKAKILIVRHIFEHVYDLSMFSEALKLLTATDGYIVFEIPDCSRSLKSFDYTMLWEEHLYYFTPETFKIALAACGFDLVHFELYPYPFENSLVAVTRIGSKPEMKVTEAIVRQELVRGMQYAGKFDDYKRKFRQFFSDYSQNRGKVALLGAGHMACTFIWLFQLQGYINCVIDDNPHKQGLYMPASRLPILPSKVLIEDDISLCFLSLNPMSEEKVILNNIKFLNRGGKFLSIFPASPHSIQQSGLI
jgi:hypothetical protein